jgi:hypothetical protein
VLLLGTSRGSIAAMNGAAHGAPQSVARVVLTESVSRTAADGQRETEKPHPASLRDFVTSSTQTKFSVLTGQPFATLGCRSIFARPTYPREVGQLRLIQQS